MAKVTVSRYDPADLYTIGFDIRTLDIRTALEEAATYSEIESISIRYQGREPAIYPDTISHLRSFQGSSFVADADGLISGTVQNIHVMNYGYLPPGWPAYYSRYDLGFSFDEIELPVETIMQSAPGQLIKNLLAGKDQISGGSAGDVILGYAGNDVIEGGNGNDILDGGTGNDKLGGGLHDDRLKGGTGDDILIGGEGRDMLYGGAGSDRFIFSAKDSAVGAGRDVIADFETGMDLLDLSRMDANDNRFDGNQSFTFIGDAGFSAAGQVRLVNGTLEANFNADLQADFQIRIRGTIGEGDLIL